jgi:phosphoglycolate phosphatase
MRDDKAVRVVFDLDGTLVDSVGSLAAAGARLCREMDRPTVSARDYAGFVGRGIKAQVVDLMRATGGLPDDGGDAAFARFREIYAQDPVSGVDEYPQAKEALLALAADGCALGVCTQKPEQPARQILTALGHMPPVSSVVGGDTLPGVLKPDPAMLWAAAEPLGQGPLIYVGDSGVDAKTAENAGVPFVLTGWGYRNAQADDLRYDALIASFSELPEVIKRLSLG